MTTTIKDANGLAVRVTRAQLVAWHEGDEHALDGACIVGRARVELEGGGVLHGLVVVDYDEGPKMMRRGVRRVVFWDRYSNTFVTCPLEAPC
jgi:hypothetical protein